MIRMVKLPTKMIYILIFDETIVYGWTRIWTRQSGSRIYPSNHDTPLFHIVHSKVWNGGSQPPRWCSPPGIHPLCGSLPWIGIRLCLIYCRRDNVWHLRLDHKRHHRYLVLWVADTLGEVSSWRIIVERNPLANHMNKTHWKQILQTQLCLQIVTEQGGGWFTIYYYRKDPPFLSLWRSCPPRTPARFTMPAARGKTSFNARDWWKGKKLFI